ncbi:MTAP family purine nucleoside phosphorylase [Metabacillus halosaccharovorans]|uniref:MTAP family purine nucleoside phosphorylase n=1 Tax=Metabacillus halosaccharovorans TaxID=930124 RepID=UPI00203D3A23|nr:MTAP family purine nucleoside phosphorylase [Metabacillus halosaccharovorans]MCM3444727.1 MTAP family purine nucleoside phosphorylase [Metabacillus halosaccharovorans]
MKIGIIGGGDIVNYNKTIEKIEIMTPFGHPSAIIEHEQINNHDLYVLKRHGKNHSISASKVNYRANIYAMKELDVDLIIGPTACGSLHENFMVGDIVLPSQLIDFTKIRESTFGEYNDVKHVSMALPFCGQLRRRLHETLPLYSKNYHITGTLMTIEGPAFSTIAESHFYRNIGAQLINMSTATEAKLARELGICYQPLSLITDMDCWDENESPVTLNQIYDNIKEKAPLTVRNIIRHWVQSLGNTEVYKCNCCNP